MRSQLWLRSIYRCAASRRVRGLREIRLRAGESLSDRSFVLSERFENTGSNAIIVAAGDGVRIRNVRIIGSAGWDPHWNDTRKEVRTLPGAFAKTVGIRAQKVRDISIEQVSIEGLPRAGIRGYGIEGGLFRDVSIRHCISGINLIHNEPSRELRLERVHTGNMWSAVDPKRPGTGVSSGRAAGSGGMDSH